MPAQKPTKTTPTERRQDDATSRLHAHAPAAHALYKEGKRIAREKRRQEWYAKHKDDK